MPKGISIPVRANANGRMSMVDGDDNNDKIIRLAMGSGDNRNAFQRDLCLDENMIFDINDPLTRTRVQARLVMIFNRFEQLKRFKLKPETIKWDDNPDKGEMILTYKYINLESDEEKQFSTSYSY